MNFYINELIAVSFVIIQDLNLNARAEFFSSSFYKSWHQRGLDKRVEAVKDCPFTCIHDHGHTSLHTYNSMHDYSCIIVQTTVQMEYTSSFDYHTCSWFYCFAYCYKHKCAFIFWTYFNCMFTSICMYICPCHRELVRQNKADEAVMAELGTLYDITKAFIYIYIFEMHSCIHTCFEAYIYIYFDQYLQSTTHQTIGKCWISFMCHTLLRLQLFPHMYNHA